MNLKSIDLKGFGENDLKGYLAYLKSAIESSRLTRQNIGMLPVAIGGDGKHFDLDALIDQTATYEEHADLINEEIKRRKVDHDATLAAVKYMETLFNPISFANALSVVSQNPGSKEYYCTFPISKGRRLNLEMRKSENGYFMQLIVTYHDKEHSILRDYFSPMDASASGIQEVANNLLCNFVFSEIGENEYSSDYHRFLPGKIENVKTRYPVGVSGFIPPSEYLVKHQS